MVVRPPRQQDRVFQILYLHEGGLSPLPAVRGDCKQVIRGTNRGGQKICWGTLVYRNQISVEFVFVCSTHAFHKNVCFTVCLNSSGFCDSEIVNTGC